MRVLTRRLLSRLRVRKNVVVEMGAQSNVAPVIIKRKKVVGGDGHHGGAWKVAYADFVTAMMAFFMLMWLLNATTEKQRKGLADYFSPTIPINRVSGGGDGAFGGESMFAEQIKAYQGTGASDRHPTENHMASGQSGLDSNGSVAADRAAFETVEEELMGRTGESMAEPELLKHIVTRVTDEGLVIELFATDDAPLFAPGTDQPTELMRALVRVVARAAAKVDNAMAVGGHIRSHPVVLAENPVWELSTERAAATRLMLEYAGTAPDRIRRVTGHADRRLAVKNPMATRNDRVEVTLLRRGREM